MTNDVVHQGPYNHDLVPQGPTNHELAPQGPDGANSVAVNGVHPPDARSLRTLRPAEVQSFRGPYRDAPVCITHRMSWMSSAPPGAWAEPCYQSYDGWGFWVH